MKAQVGDWLVLKGRTNGQPDQRGMITEVATADGWLDSAHLALVYPGSDAIVVNPAEQEAADERARLRVASIQAAIMNRPQD